MVIALVVVVAGGYFWMNQQVGELPEDELVVITVAYGNVEDTIPATGTLQPKDIVPVGARASGELVRIYVEVGDFVEAGQIVALIDAREQELRVESSRLNLRNQESQLDQRQLAAVIAANNYDRTLMMFEADASTEQELENARTSMVQARTSLRNLEIAIERSKTDLAQEEVQLDYTEIKAPISGTIISLDQQEGATLNATRTAPTVMQVADLTTLTVETEISEADIPWLEIGVDTYFTTASGGDRRWYGALRKIDPMGTVQNNIVMFNGSFDVDNTDGDLLPNMTTEVFFVTSSAQDVLTVPIGSLTFADTRGIYREGPPVAGSIALKESRAATVERLLPDGSTERVEVEVGATDPFNAEIVAGLDEGDQIVALASALEVDEEPDAVTSASW